MDNFYDKCGGLTILVIYHHGKTFDYVNGPKNNPYFSKWKYVLPFMVEDNYYVIPTIITDKGGKNVLIPLGVAYAIDDEQEAKELSFEHVKAVAEGTWNPKEEIRFFTSACHTYRAEFLKMVDEKMEILTKGKLF